MFQGFNWLFYEEEYIANVPTVGLMQVYFFFIIIGRDFVQCDGVMKTSNWTETQQGLDFVSRRRGGRKISYFFFLPITRHPFINLHPFHTWGQKEKGAKLAKRSANGKALPARGSEFAFSFPRRPKAARWRLFHSALKLISPRAFNPSPFCIPQYISCTKNATSFG